MASANAAIAPTASPAVTRAEPISAQAAGASARAPNSAAIALGGTQVRLGPLRGEDDQDLVAGLALERIGDRGGLVDCPGPRWGLGQCHAAVASRHAYRHPLGGRRRISPQPGLLLQPMDAKQDHRPDIRAAGSGPRFEATGRLGRGEKGLGRLRRGSVVPPQARPSS